MSCKRSVVCRICKSFDGEVGVCKEGQLTGPDRKEDCWTFIHKSQKVSVSEPGEYRGEHRL